MASPAIGTGTGEVSPIASNTSTESVTITTPTNAASGDLLIAYVVTAVAKTVTSSGWTSIIAATEASIGNEAEFFYRYHDGSSTYAFSWSGGGNTANCGAMVRVTGSTTSGSPVDVSASKTNNSFGTTQDAPSVTTTVADTLLLCLYGWATTGTCTAPSGMTEVTDGGATTCKGSLDKLAVSGTGATGTKTATWSTSYWAVALSIAIKPAPSLIKSIGSVPIASVKKVSGVAIASAKKVAGVANT